MVNFIINFTDVNISIPLAWATFIILLISCLIYCYYHLIIIADQNTSPEVNLYSPHIIKQNLISLFSNKSSFIKQNLFISICLILSTVFIPVLTSFLTDNNFGNSLKLFSVISAPVSVIAVFYLIAYLINKFSSVPDIKAFTFLVVFPITSILILFAVFSGIIMYSITIHYIPDTKPLHSLYLLLSTATIFFLCMWHEKFFMWLENIFAPISESIIIFKSWIEVITYIINLGKSKLIIIVAFPLVFTHSRVLQNFHYFSPQYQDILYAIRYVFVLLFLIWLWHEILYVKLLRRMCSSVLVRTNEDEYNKSRCVVQLRNMAAKENIATRLDYKGMKKSVYLLTKEIDRSCEQISTIHSNILENKEEIIAEAINNDIDSNFSFLASSVAALKSVDMEDKLLAKYQYNESWQDNLDKTFDLAKDLKCHMENKNIVRYFENVKEFYLRHQLIYIFRNASSLYQKTFFATQMGNSAGPLDNIWMKKAVYSLTEQIDKLCKKLVDEYQDLLTTGNEINPSDVDRINRNNEPSFTLLASCLPALKNIVQDETKILDRYQVNKNWKNNLMELQDIVKQLLCTTLETSYNMKKANLFNYLELSLKKHAFN